ncbi:hypothetical protein [uncultured Draconibacterium sp.]|uniref:hypothetical protein n=1 Tax=uncultured Draconibacterium sp. TaxID=1573823 RepID=UPI0029C7BB73|nr:hypothetical protein [uncultured Draconibacterium sp.]
MKLAFTILILTLSFQNLFCQIDSAFIILKSESNIDTISKFEISKSKTHFYKADLTPWKILKDSGMFNAQNEKIGFWKEFPIDTTIIDSDDNIKVQNPNSKIFEPKIIRLEGNYKNGKKDGLWKEYIASIRSKPFFWDLNKTSEFENNLKNGREVWFEPFSKDTMMIFLYKNDEPIKQIK